MARQVLIWEREKTYGVVVANVEGTGYFRRRAYLVANSDRVTWTAVRPDPAKSIKSYLPEGVRLISYRGSARLPAHLRALAEWTETALKGKGTDSPVAVPAGQFEDTQALPYPSPLTAHLGAVTYVGFREHARASMHPLQSIHYAVNAAVARVIAIWGWTPRDLEVSFHDSGRSFGLAYEPGKRKPGEPLRISLARALIAKYDLNSIARVVLHELCHHYREETWPRYRRPGDSHDAVFCRELARVDERANDPDQCATFNDDEDASVVQARVQKRAEAVAGASFAPNAGVLEVYVSGNRISFAWAPRLGFSWKKLKEPASDESVLELLKRFAPRDWRSVEVAYPLKWRHQAKNMQEYMVRFVRLNARAMPKSAAYIAETEPEWSKP